MDSTEMSTETRNEPAPDDGSGSGEAATLLALRVVLEDRPGALGLVASRIGALRADIVGIDVLERGTGVVIDEFALALSDPEVLDLLVREVEEVDGATVDSWRVVQRFPDPRLDALVSAERLCRCTSALEIYRALAHDTNDEFEADWAAVLTGDAVPATAGPAPPDPHALRALVGRNATSDGPPDVAVVAVPAGPASLCLRRAGRAFRQRELAQLRALAGIADRCLVHVEGGR